MHAWRKGFFFSYSLLPVVYLSKSCLPVIFSLPYLSVIEEIEPSLVLCEYDIAFLPLHLIQTICRGSRDDTITTVNHLCRV